MRVCVNVEGQEGVGWSQWVALARACEAAGIEALFSSDHYLSTVGRFERGSLDTWATLAGLAAVTSKLRLGSIVSPSTFRHPSELSKVVATVDHISGGRVELGLGAGWYEREHRMYGFPFPEHRVRLEVFAEQLEIIKRQWTDEVFDFEGRHYRLEGCRSEPKPLQKPSPPIMVGGLGRRGTADPAARFADEYNVPFATQATCLECRQRLREACERVGRDPATLTFSLMTGFVTAESESTLLERVRRVMEWENETGSPEQFIAGKREEWIVGTVPDVIRKLRELEEIGVQRVFLQLLDFEDLDAVALIGDRIIPAVGGDARLERSPKGDS